MNLSVQERFIASPWGCIPAGKTFTSDSVTNKVTNRNIAVIKSSEPLASLNTRLDPIDIERPEPLALLNIRPGYVDNDPASMRRPYGDDCTPKNVEKVSDRRFKSILVLHEEIPPNPKDFLGPVEYFASLNSFRRFERFKKLAENCHLKVSIDPNCFIKDGFSTRELPPEKLDYIVKKLRGMEKPIVYCGAGDGRSGVVKAAYRLNFFDKKDMIESSDIRTSRVRVYTYLNDEFESCEKYTKTTTAVANAINDIRRRHPKAIERVNDVIALENYHYFLSRKYIEELLQYKKSRHAYHPV